MALPSLHAPAFVTVQRVEEMWSSVGHGGAGELRGAGRQDGQTWCMASEEAAATHLPPLSLPSPPGEKHGLSHDPRQAFSPVLSSSHL